MRCNGCGKRFDYEKYYGICPKCGTFNKREEEQELHAELHEAYDSSSLHAELHEQYDRGQNHTEPEWREAEHYAESHMKIEKKRSGNTALIVGLVLVFLALFLNIIAAPLVETAMDKAATAESYVGQMKAQQVQVGEEISIQDVTFQVEHAKVLFPIHTQDGRETGQQLVGVYVKGTSDGEYKDSNQFSMPYLFTEVNSEFRQCVSGYSLGSEADTIGTLWTENELCWNEEVEGYFLFVTDAEAEKVIIYFEDRDYEKTAKPLTGVYQVELLLEEEAVYE